VERLRNDAENRWKKWNEEKGRGQSGMEEV
jgi:hypothetical protein